jgi:RES domain-containing protein
MMIVYRIGRTKYANDLTGEGSRLNGGRWNHKLTACVYTSESRALALLEYTVNVNIDAIPRALSFAAVEIPDDNILQLNIANLPGDWSAAPAPASTKHFGTALLKQAGYAVIKVPSAVIPDEYNYLLNPLSKESTKFKVVEVRDFVYDIRIKMV